MRIDCKLDESFLISEFNNSKEKAIKSFNKGNYEKALTYIEHAADIAVSFPIFQQYCDEDLENVLSKISNNFKNIIKSNKILYRSEERIVFYNGQIVDLGALTEQYLNAFERRKVKVLIIVPDKKNIIFGTRIIEKIKNNFSFEMFIPCSHRKLDKIQEIINKIVKYNPTVAFLHFLPNDVVGSVVFGAFENLKKFFIDHNDHTFWLGKFCADYFIEFRNFGVSLAYELRKIPQDKILKIPFYPINNHQKFKGFPFDRKGKVVGISGANLTKYYGDNLFSYFNVIKQLLYENSEFVFCLCGWGDAKPILNFFKEPEISNRFFYLGKRNDFYELVGNCDIYIESYPMKGGLSALFAIEQKVPVIGIASYNNPSGSLEEFYEIENYHQPRTFDEFKEQATLLIKNKEYRKQLSEILFNNSFKKEKFMFLINELLDGKVENTKPKEILPLKLNYKEYLKENLNKHHSNKYSYYKRKLVVFQKYSNPLLKIKCIILIIFFGAICLFKKKKVDEKFF